MLFENSASDVTAYKYPIYEDPIVHRDRKFKFESSDLFFSSEREVEGRSPRQVRSWRAPHPFGIVIRNVSAGKTTVERVDSRD